MHSLVCVETRVFVFLAVMLALKPPYNEGQLNGYGQALTMNVYQLANMLIATSTNYQPYLEYWDVYLTPEIRLERTASHIDRCLSNKRR